MIIVGVWDRRLEDCCVTTIQSFVWTTIANNYYGKSYIFYYLFIYPSISHFDLF